MPEEKPNTENKEMTGSHDPVTDEQARNIIVSPEYDKKQRDRIARDVANQANPYQEGLQTQQDIQTAISLIEKTKDGQLLAGILRCHFAGLTDKRVALAMMKSDRDVPEFSTVEKAIKFVQDAKVEGLYRVKVALAKRKVVLAH